MAWMVGKARPRPAILTSARPEARSPERPPARPPERLLLAAGGAAYGWCLAGGGVVAMLFLAVAGYVALGYLINAAMVALVVGLCAAGAWLAVEVRYRWVGHLDARRSRARAGGPAPLAPPLPVRPER